MEKRDLLTNCATRLESEEAHYTRLVEQYRELEAKVGRLREAASAVTHYLMWHEDGDHYTEVDVDRLRTLAAALEEGEQDV